MNRPILVAALLSLLTATAAQAGDAKLGKALVEANCTRCHGSEVYTRPDHKVKSFDGLVKQVSHLV